jgi:hypothetical protein
MSEAKGKIGNCPESYVVSLCVRVEPLMDFEQGCGTPCSARRDGVKWSGEHTGGCWDQGEKGGGVTEKPLWSLVTIGTSQSVSLTIIGK